MEILFTFDIHYALPESGHISLQPDVVAELCYGDGDEGGGGGRLGEEEPRGGDAPRGTALVEHVLERGEQPEEPAGHEHCRGNSWMRSNLSNADFLRFGNHNMYVLLILPY